MMKLMVERVMPIIYGSFCYVLPFYYLNSIGDAIIYGIPWATLHILFGSLFVNDILWHFLYLSLTCYYFMLKLSYIIRQIKESENANDALKRAQKLNSIHIEIHTYNRQFWSTHIADSLMQFIFLINFDIYSALFNVDIIRFLKINYYFPVSCIL